MQAQKAEQFFASRMAEQEQQRRDALKKGPMYRLDWVSPACHANVAVFQHPVHSSP